jgi:hypothetical protein
MKVSIAGFILSLCLSILPSAQAADAPHELGGFVLGGRMAEFKDMVRSETVLPMRYLESLKEVEIKDISGFKVGLVYYTTCSEPSRIVRLKFKYADSSKKFYDALLQRFKARFGEPDKWRGDPFHIVVSWKWSFVDNDDNDISLILQHNARDEEEKMGNSIKLTMWNLMQAESRCFANQSTETAGSDTFRYQEDALIDWSRFIPR